MSDAVGSDVGWKPDPLGRYAYRWWSGTAWTDQVHQGSGDYLVDPLGLRPGPLEQFPSVPSFQAYPVVTESTKSPGIAVASLVLGVGSFFVALIPILGLVSVPFALVGLVLGIAGLGRARRGFEGKGISIVGIVTSVLALLLAILWLVSVTALSSWGADTLDEIDSDVSNGVCDQSRFIQDPDC